MKLELSFLVVFLGGRSPHVDNRVTSAGALPVVGGDNPPTPLRGDGGDGDHAGGRGTWGGLGGLLSDECVEQGAAVVTFL